MKYFIVKATGVVIAVPKVKTGEGKNATDLVLQYASRPDFYTECDKNGKPVATEPQKSKTEK